jgi:protease IV
MLRLLKGIWGLVTTARNVLLNLLFIALVAFVVLSILSTESVGVPDSAALVLDPSGMLVEQTRVVDPLNRYLSGRDGGEPETRLGDIMRAIGAAKTDDRIKMIVIHPDSLAGAPMSMLEDLGEALTDFKESNKPILSFAGSYDQTQYYLASHADRIFLDSHSIQAFGGVLLTGLGIYPTYFKAALDKLKIRFHVFKAGQYKGAVEPYLRDDMSPEARTANSEWIGSLWADYAATIIRQRGITDEAFTRYTHEYDVLLGDADNDSAQLAVDQSLVDELISEDEFRTKVLAIVGGKDGDYHKVGFRAYLHAIDPTIPVTNPNADKVAVLIAKGTILDGEQPAGEIGGDTISRLIKGARDDKTIKALVLRIDSPGGSASASEQIRHELELMQQQGKPVVVSMGGYAASGGYWVSATANKIFARSTTVTGSIGTFIIFPTVDEGLAEFGINTDGVGTTPLSSAFDPFQPMNPILERTLERSVARTYSLFESVVARGRDMAPGEVDDIAQGRVWSGKKALELGLIDALGSLTDAIDSAALLAGVGDFEVVYLEQKLSARERLVNQILNSALPVVATDLPLVTRASAAFRDLLNMSIKPGVYVDCLACRALR